MPVVALLPGSYNVTCPPLSHWSLSKVNMCNQMNYREGMRGWSRVRAKGYYPDEPNQCWISVGCSVSAKRPLSLPSLLFLSGRSHLVFTLFQDIASWVQDPRW